MALRIGVVAGEVSGDLLGAGLLAALQQRFPDIECEGICGPEMIALGAHSLFPMDKLAVMGLVEVLDRYREIKGIRDQLIAHFVSRPPDVFIGIDAPDFNLGLERALRRVGIPTVQYVSPQVWAWRGYRIRTIRRAVDRMLVLFPFEEAYYRDRGVPVTFVGHPMADQIPLKVDRIAAQERLKLPKDRIILALLPGSRLTELKAHADLFVRTALWLHARNPQLHFVIPFVSRPTRLVFEEAIKHREAWDLPITRMFGHARDAMAAAEVVIAASGTATLEAALLKRPLVVTYRMARLSSWIIRAFSHVKHYALPNHLAGRAVVPELLQADATPEKLGAAVEEYLTNPQRTQDIVHTFDEIHRSLRANASESAADAVAALISGTATVTEAGGAV